MTSNREALRVAAVSVLFLLSFFTTAHPDDTEFRKHEAQGNQAEKTGNLNEALRHFTAACRTEAEPVLEVMRHSSCERAVEIAQSLDALENTRATFEQDCSGGSDFGCYTLAWVEERRGDLGRAVGLMGRLCDKGFSWPPVVGLDACSERSRLHKLRITIDPSAAKRSAAGMLLLMALPPGAILAYRKRALSVTFMRLGAWSVAFPYVLLLLSRLWSGLLLLAFLPLSFYFFPPALLFGKPHFMIAIGAGPTDAIGMLYAAGFYLDVTCALALVVYGWKCARTQSRQAQP